MYKAPSGWIFSSALEFYALAKPALENPEKLQEQSMAVVCNLALCVELLLKCSDFGVKTSPVQPGGLIGDAEIYSKVYGHDLEKIFKNIDPSIAQKLEILFKKSVGRDLKPLLSECKDYFVNARYSYESNSRSSYKIGSIQILAEGLIESINCWHSA